MLTLINTQAIADIPKCTASIYSQLKTLNHITSPKQIVKVAQGSQKNKKLLGHIVFTGSECSPKFVLNDGSEFEDLSGYTSTGAGSCTLDEAYIKSTQLIDNANKKLNNWTPVGNALNNGSHYEKRWNFAGILCTNLSKAEAKGCKGSCKLMLEEEGKVEFCKTASSSSMMKACYESCCK